jgi:hypothetical protein
MIVIDVFNNILKEKMKATENTQTGTVMTQDGLVIIVDEVGRNRTFALGLISSGHTILNKKIVAMNKAHGAGWYRIRFNLTG